MNNYINLLYFSLKSMIKINIIILYYAYKLFNMLPNFCCLLKVHKFKNNFNKTFWFLNQQYKYPLTTKTHGYNLLPTYYRTL